MTPPGVAPELRRATRLFSSWNQNGAPSLMASPVKSQPGDLTRQYALASVRTGLNSRATCREAWGFPPAPATAPEARAREADRGVALSATGPPRAARRDALG